MPFDQSELDECSDFCGVNVLACQLCMGRKINAFGNAKSHQQMFAGLFSWRDVFRSRMPVAS